MVAVGFGEGDLMAAHDIPRRRFDTLVIGAGGGGLRAALQLSQAEATVAVVSKVFPTRLPPVQDHYHHL